MLNASLRQAANWPQRSARFILCVCICAVLAGPAVASDLVNAPEIIGSMEKTLSGQCKTGLPLLLRMDALETISFGQPSTGALSDRIARLQRYLGMESAASKASAGPGKEPPNQSASSKVSTSKKLANETASSEASSSKKLANETASSKASSSKKLANEAASSKATSGNQNADEQTGSPPIKYPAQLQKLMTDAIYLYHEGNLEAAKIAFENILSNYPDCVDACYDLGALAEKRGDRTTAIKYYYRAQYLAPDDEQIQGSIKHLKELELASNSNLENAPPNLANAPTSWQNASSQPESPPLPSGQNQTSNLSPAADPSSSGPLNPSPGANQGQANANYGQALHTAVNAGKSILNYTLNKAMSNIHNF